MSQKEYSHIFQPITIGSTTLKNRIVFSPTFMGLEKEAYARKILQIAEGGAGLIIIGGVPVVPCRRFPSLRSSKDFSFFQSLIQKVHEKGAKLCVQLYMPDTGFYLPLKKIPQILSRTISLQDLRLLQEQAVIRRISSLSRRKILKILTHFGKSAALAQKAGFDMIQIQGDGMCGSFSCSLTNHRSDRYGGSPANRARFACQAVWAAKRAAPGLPVDYRLVIRRHDLGRTGILADELSVFIPRLEHAGADSFQVTLAGLNTPKDSIPPACHPSLGHEGYTLSLCRQIRPLTSRPLCAAGGLTDPDLIQQNLQEGVMDLAAMSRQLIADPQWPMKVSQGDTASIFYCIRCNQECVGGLAHHRGVRCIYDRIPSRWPGAKKIS